MRYKRVASWAVPLLILAALTYIFGYSNLLQVKSISFSGSANQAQIQSAINNEKFNLKVGSKLARVNVRGAERAISNIGWVKKVVISRNWFTGKVFITVEPRTAIAQVIGSGGTSLIDASGFFYSDPQAAGTLPRIQIASQNQAQEAAKFIAGIPSELLARMSNLNLDAKNGYLMALSSPNLTINWGDSKNLAIKVKIYERLIALPENKSMSQLDLSDPKFPIVKK